ncbi:MAG TPA: hypothetical protein VKK19_06530 [Candidatus Dormibacteraeota bacterium]|nr:hypothetical protein [Candidatus Dormibacteraeota bacterium]
MYGFVDPDLTLDLIRLRMEELRPTGQMAGITSRPRGDEKLRRRVQKPAASETRSSTSVAGWTALLRLRARS